MIAQWTLDPYLAVPGDGWGVVVVVQYRGAGGTAVPDRGMFLSVWAGTLAFGCAVHLMPWNRAKRWKDRDTST